MGLPAAAAVGLERALHDEKPLLTGEKCSEKPKYYRRMRGGVNARALMLKSNFLRAFPRSFPQLWKKMWKSHGITPVSVGENLKAPDFADVFQLRRTCPA
jgi:hypothetical protein